MIFIGYEDNGYRFIRHTQGNAIFRSTQAIFDEGHFPRCPSSHPREQIPPGRLTPEIESSAPRPSGIDEPAPISFPPTPVHPRPPSHFRHYRCSREGVSCGIPIPTCICDIISMYGSKTEGRSRGEGWDRS